MSFEEYLISKKIDSQAFLAGDPERWNEWKQLFEVMNPASFTAQKLYLINPLRRKYLLKITEANSKLKVTAPVSRPVMKPKMN